MKDFPIGVEAIKKRAAIISNDVGKFRFSQLPKVSVAVINVTDYCNESCAHCLYSAPMTVKRASKTSYTPPSINLQEAMRVGTLLNDAGVNQIVFSGGGEPTLNLEAIDKIITKSLSAKSMVLVTSGHFFNEIKKEKEVSALLKNFLLADDDRKVYLRISLDSQHSLSGLSLAEGILRFYDDSVFKNKVNFIIRCLFDDKYPKYEELTRNLKAKIYPDFSFMPVIDGFPCRWIVGENIDIPIIYKPTYNTGQGRKFKKIMHDKTYWKNIKAAEEQNERFFNLSLRGPNGEGHNYYGTVALGYKHWCNIKSPPIINSGCKQDKKRLCLYIPSDGRLLLNAGSPDSWLSVKDSIDWQLFVAMIEKDPLQWVVATQPTDVLVARAMFIGVDVEDEIERTNFVFTLPYASMSTPSLRLYQTMVALESNPENFYSRWGYKFENIANKVKEDFSTKSIDPIMGSEPSVWQSINMRG